MTRETLAWIIGAVAIGLWLALSVAVVTGEIRILHSATAGPLIESIETAEGFRGSPYMDSAGNPTVGFGTKLPLTEAEGRLLLVHRLELAESCIATHWKPWRVAGRMVRDVLAQMVYQLGCGHLIHFDHMLDALAHQDYRAAHRFGLDSIWARHFPKRASRVLAPLLTKETSR